jgi:hypothetical protein
MNAKDALLGRVQDIIAGIEGNRDAEIADAQKAFDAAKQTAEQKCEEQLQSVIALVTPPGTILQIHEEPPAVPPLPQGEPGD